MAQIQRKWLSAMVTYKGGQSYSVRGETFHLNRGKLIMDEALVDECRPVPGFVIKDNWEPVTASEELFDKHEGLSTVEKATAIMDDGRKAARNEDRRARKVLRKKITEE